MRNALRIKGTGERIMHRELLATAVTVALLLGTVDANAQAVASEQDQADVRTLMAQLQALKASYGQEVRRLRELDMQVQALQARLAGKTPTTTLPAQPSSETAPAPDRDQRPVARNTASTQAGTLAEAQKAQHESTTRSMQDALLQDHALFDRKLTLENSLTYSRYDRKQLTLNGFLALDAIFLGNIAIENVRSDTLTYTLAARYGVSPRLTLNLEAPFLARQTAYQKGGAGGSAAAIAEETTTGSGLGDLSLSANYKLFNETASVPDTVLTFGVTAPTGRAPYGIDWNVLDKSDDDTLRFAVPAQQPTGNGMWQGTLGLSAIKTLDPAILFANVGYIGSVSRGFNDIDTDPETRTPGRVKLGNSYYFGAGVAFAFNERTSLSLSFSDKITTKASLRSDGQSWQKVIGSDGNAGTFNMGVTYALDKHTTLVTLLGVGLTPDAPDFTLTLKVPYMF